MLFAQSFMRLYEYDGVFLYHMVFMIKSQILVVKLGLNHVHKTCALW